MALKNTILNFFRVRTGAISTSLRRRSVKIAVLVRALVSLSTTQIKKRIMDMKCLFYGIRSNEHVRVMKWSSPLLGPKGVDEYTYTFGMRIYTVVLDTAKTDFKKFSDALLLLKEKDGLPTIPNRAVASSPTFDMDKFNRFLGPDCDFHRRFKGTNIPENMFFFMKDDVRTTNENSVTLVDTTGRMFFFDQNSRVSDVLKGVWQKDCFPKTI